MSALRPAADSRPLRYASRIDATRASHHRRMQSAALKLLALFLLLSQSWLGLARGQSVCLRLAPCAQHAIECETHEHTCDADHHEHDACAADHQHGLVEASTHQHGDCGCHLHVSVPSVELARVAADADLDCALPLGVCVCIIPLVTASDLCAECSVMELAPRPPDRPSDECRSETRGLRVNKLLL